MYNLLRTVNKILTKSKKYATIKLKSKYKNKNNA